MDKGKIVDPSLYSKEYFLSDNEGFVEYSTGLDDRMHLKFQLAMKYGRPVKGDLVLDIGCGRGELVYYCAKMGAKAFGIDYSKAAIDLAKAAIQKLPEDVRNLASAEVGDPVTYDFKDRYDIVFMIEVAEHMYDWQLKTIFEKMHKVLKPGGRIIITTPNYYYEEYLSPLKRIINIPLGLIRWPIRVLKGKYKQTGPMSGLKKVFRIKADRGELNRNMHVNVMTPGKLKSLLSNFETKVICEDHSINLISLLVKRWCGRNMIVVASKQ